MTAEQKLQNAVTLFTRKAQALLGFFLMMEKRPTDNLSVIVRIVAKPNCNPYFEYCPDRIVVLNDSLLGSLIYMECLRLALHHCDATRSKSPADIYKLCSDLIVAEYARYIVNTNEGDNERILSMLFPSLGTYTDILARHSFDYGTDLYLERLFAILVEEQDDVRSARDDRNDAVNEEKNEDNDEDSTDDSDNGSGDNGVETDEEDSSEEDGGEAGSGRSEYDDADEDSGSSDSGDAGDSSGSDGDRTDSATSNGEWSEFDTVQDYFSQQDVVDDWNASESVAEEIRQEARNADREHLFDYMRNTLPRAIREANLVKPNVRDMMRFFIGSIRSDEFIESRNVRNRRFGLARPGYRRISRPSILLALDVSGSMWDALDDCIAFIQSVSQEIDIDVCYWDTICGEPKSVGRRSEIDDVSGGGGTNPECIVEKYDTDGWNYNGIVVITDCIFQWNEPEIARKIMIVRVGNETWSHPDWCLYKVEMSDLVSEL